MCDLTNGPAKLTQALSITTEQNGLDLTRRKELFISEPRMQESFEVVSTRRIGIKAGVNRQWRFYIKKSEFVSLKKIRTQNNYS
jgi:DNA-3-methyladenine glycosylase